MIRIASLDHLVLTVASIEATCTFYRAVLGMAVETSAGGRTALRFGAQKINLHEAGHTFEPKAASPTPGSGDLCFLLEGALDEVMAGLQRLGVPLVEGPVDRSGATGPIRSVYLRDPDGNLIELSEPRAA